MVQSFKPLISKVILLTVFILSGFYTTFASATQPVFDFKQYAKEQGLGNPFITKVLQDRQGYIWIGTQDGLYRFNGYTFKAFKHQPDQDNALADNYIQHLFQDSQGRMWISIYNGGFALYHPDTETFTNYRHNSEDSNSLNNDAVMAITEDRQGHLWIATLGGGLNRFNPDNNHFKHFRHEPHNRQSLSDDNIYIVLQDSQDHLWLGTRHGGLNRFDQKTGKFTRYQYDATNPNSLSHNKVYTLLEDSKGTLWVGTRGGGLNRFERKTGSFKRYQHQPDSPQSLGSDQVYALFEDNQKSLWIGTDGGGLNRFDHTNNRFERYQHNPLDHTSLANNRIYAITQDQTGLVWLGTYGDGLNTFDPSSERFGYVKHDSSKTNSLSQGAVRAIFKDSRGILWTGTDSGLNSYNPITKQFTHYQHHPDNPNSLSDNAIKSLFSDSAGILWVGTGQGGLNRFNRQNNTFIRYQHNNQNSHSLSDNRVLAIHEDSSGYLWAGTANGLNRLKPQSRFTHSKESTTGISHNKINTLYTAQDGTLWIGTNGGGLNQFNPQTQTFTQYHHDPDVSNSLSHNTVTSIDQDAHGIFWIGSFGGLNRFDPVSETFTHYRQKDGLSNDQIQAVMVDRDNRLWLGTLDGISLYDVSSATFQNNIGIQAGCKGVNQGAFFKAADGQLFFGGNHGYCAFYPDQVNRPTLQHPVVLSDFRLLNQSVPVATKDRPSPLTRVISQTNALTLNHRDNILSFEFAALHYVSPNDNQYQYKLEGFHNQWITTAADNRRATFTNLPAGDYIFKVKASNNEGVWSEQVRAIQLTIEPAPWRTWWAYTIYALLLGGVIAAFVYVQRQKVLYERSVVLKLKQLDKLKDEFLANTSHELRTPLNGIIGLAESLIDGARGPLDSKVNKDLAMVVSSGKRLANLINDILDFSKLKSRKLVLSARPIDLHNLTEEVLALSQSLIGRQKTLTLTNAIPTDLPAALADDNRLQQILLNLVGNAIKFTETGEVTVSAVVTGKQLTVTVIDTGIGIAKDKFTSIFDAFEQTQGEAERGYSGTGLGLSVSKQLVELHDGTIWLESQLGEGSTFGFTLPLADHAADTSGDHTVSRLHLLEEDEDNEEEDEKDVIITSPVSHDGSQFRILLVDDEPVNRQVLLNHLSLQDYQLVEAAGGEQALQEVEKNGPFDLILLDVMMPKVSGFDVCQQLREVYSLNDLPVIFLTAKNQVADMMHSFAVGANDYLTKPVSKHELLTRVETHLKFLDIHRNLEGKVAERTAELVQSNQQMTSLSEIAGEISAILDMNHLLDIVYYRIKPLMSVDVFSIGLYEPDSDRISFKLAIEEGERLPEFFYHMDEKDRPAVWCIEHRKPLIMNDYSRDFATWFDCEQPPRPTAGKWSDSVLYWPLLVGNHIIGVLTVQSYQKNAYNEHHQMTIQTLASTTAIALDNANAYRQIEQKSQEVEQKNRAIIDTQQQLVQAEKMASLGTLTAGVAHEINNPTNFVHVSTQNLEIGLQRFQQFLFDLVDDTASDEILDSFKQQFDPLYEHLTTIKNGTHRIKIIVQDLRAFTQLDSAEQQIVTITELLQSTVNLVKTRFMAVTEFVTEFEDTPKLDCYPAQLNQVFMNLIVNACDAIQTRQQSLSGDLPLKGQIIIGCKVRQDTFGKTLEISIKDNGCGMTAKTKNKLFEPFYTTKEVGKGTGLGLSISWGIVQRHGGELSVESELGRGSIFSLRLPL